MSIALIIFGVLIVIGIIIAISVSNGRTPDHLGGYYGSMYWVIGGIGIAGAIGAVIFALCMIFA